VRTFFDSSAFAKRFVDEPGSQTVEDLCSQATEVCVSVICVPEIVSALNRLTHEQSLTRAQYLTAKHRLSDDVRDAVIVNLTPAVIRSSIAVLEASRVRALDALHVACALEWRAQLFVSADQRQIVAARKAGLRARQI
jgi:predicted nucleic acid-binding protein